MRLCVACNGKESVCLQVSVCERLRERERESERERERECVCLRVAGARCRRTTVFYFFIFSPERETVTVQKKFLWNCATRTRYFTTSHLMVLLILSTLIAQRLFLFVFAI